MRKYIQSLFVVASSFVLFTNCSKDDDSTPATANYSPLTNGSNWTYNFTQGTTTGSYKLTVNRDSTINGKAYKVLTSSVGQNRYMARNNNEYYRFQSFPTLGINNFEELYLVDNKEVNGTWTNTANFTYNFNGQSIPLTATLSYTLKEKGITRTVNNKAYSDVIHVRLDISVSLVGTIGGGDFYYAKGVGMIEDNISISGSNIPSYNYTETLTASEIK